MNLYTHQDSNVRKTWLFMTAFLVLVIALGWLFGQILQSEAILYAAIVLSLVMNITAYWQSDKIALAVSGARPVAREQNVRLYRILENLSITAGLPVPRVYMMNSGQINAFATGRDAKHAAVAVTAGALERLDDNELTGVLAHELSHIGNRDILLSSMVVVLAGLVSLMANWFLHFSWGGRSSDDDRGSAVLLALGIVAAVLAPVAATLIQLAISRKREFLADASGVLLTRYPEGLAGALEKIAHDQEPMRMASGATAHLFLASPFKGRQLAGWAAKLFMTHPPIQERIKILRGLNI